MSPEKAKRESWNPLRDLDNWWFGKGSPVTLGVFRVIMGLVTFASLALTLFDFEAWYTERGFVPQKAVAGWVTVPPEFTAGPLHVVLPFHTLPRLNVLSYVADSRLTLAVYFVVMVAALLTALGLWTRLSTIVLAVGLVSIHHRDPLILHSGDTLMRLSVIYLAWGPSGAACSLDRVIALWQGRAGPEPTPISLWPQRLIQYQVAIVYFTTAWWKHFGSWWMDGTATWYPENLNEFDRFPVPDFLRHQPFIGLTTYGTLIVELSLATLVFYKPLRKIVLLAGVAMHGYIEYRFNIPFFAVTIIGTYICFYEGDEVSAWARRLGNRLWKLRLAVQTPVSRQLSPTGALALGALDPLGLVSYSNGSNPDWTASKRKGGTANPFRGSHIRSVGAWPFALIPGLWRRLLTGALAAETDDHGPEPDRQLEDLVPSQAQAES